MDAGPAITLEDAVELPVPGAPVTLETTRRVVSAHSAGETLRPTRRRGRAGRIRRWAVAVGFVGVVAVCAGGLVVLALTQEQPGWWGPVDADDPATIVAAERVENGVATLLTQARPPGHEAGQDAGAPWTVSLSAADANAWLNARLPKWLATQEDITFEWPPEVAEVRVAFDDGLIFVGAKVRTAASRSGAGKEQVLSAAVAPRFEDDGSLWMPAEHIGLGRLGIPATWVLGHGEGGGAASAAAGANVPDGLADLPQTREIMNAFAGKNAVMTNPTIRLGDGRRVRLLSLTARDGKLLITCMTELRNAERADSGTTQPDGVE